MRLFSALLISALLAAPSVTNAQQLFDFDGQATAVANLGDVLTCVSVIANAPGVAMPLPLDTDNFEYTVVVENLMVDLGPAATTAFINGAISIYKDAVTPADYNDMSTFTDGIAILEGVLNSFQVTMFTSTLGAGSGLLDWTGGSRIDDLHPNDRLNWSYLVSVSTSASLVLPGYAQRWDGKVEPQEEVVPGDKQSWGDLKTTY